jgi:hypothetical protein
MEGFTQHVEFKLSDINFKVENEKTDVVTLTATTMFDSYQLVLRGDEVIRKITNQRCPEAKYLIELFKQASKDVREQF